MGQELERALEVAVDLARRAGAAALPWWPKPGTERAELEREIGLREKGDEGPVTRGDHAADAVILAGLREAFPGDGVVTEESGESAEAWAKPRLWLVDPIDGTKDFVRGEQGWSVMIGLCIERRPVAGIVFQPTTNRLWLGAEGLGAFEEDPDGARTALSVTATSALEELRMVVSRSHRDQRVNALIDAVQPAAVASIGSVGLKACTVAEGSRELYLHPSVHTKLWDTAAGEAIVRAAGGEVTDMRGEPLLYAPDSLRHLHGLAVSNSACHAAAVDRVRELAP